MFSRSVQVFVPTRTQVRGMATLKEIRIRLKSVINIQKITKSMKMVSAAKYARAERELRPARSYGAGAQAFFDKAEVEADATKQRQLVVALTSDRGLCGGVHSSVCKAIKSRLNEQDSSIETKLVVIGDKAKMMLQRLYSKNIVMSFNNIGKKPSNFNDAAMLANELTNVGYQYDHGTMYFNIFKSVLSYNTSELLMYTEEDINNAKKLSIYDSVDEDTLRCYNEFSFVSRVYYALKEAACSEQSSRMTAMDSASKNASEMIDKLTLTFNRTRQAVITRELIEIISGAAAL